MTPPTPGPRCPRCHRALAAWRLNHCVYCGETFPEELKAGFAEPEGLKWVERPPLPPDLSKKLEVMRITTTAPPRKSRLAMALAGAAAVPVVGGLLYFAYILLRQLSPVSATLVLIVGIGALGYLGFTIYRSRSDVSAARSPGTSPPRGR